MAGPLPTSLWGLWVSGPLPPYNGGPCTRAATRKRLGPRAGIPKGLRPNCNQARYSRTSVECINAKRGGGPKTPLYERKGPENPDVVAPFAVAGCRRNRRRAVDRRLGKIDLRPCLLRLRSSLFVLACTGLIPLKVSRIQFIDRVLNFPVVVRRRGTYSVTVQKTVKIPQMQWLDKLNYIRCCLTTAVEVPQLLGVPVEIPQVQFLDKLDTPVVCNDSCRGQLPGFVHSLDKIVTCPLSCISSTMWSMSLLCSAMGFRRCSSSTVMVSPSSCAASAQLLTWRIDSALGSEFKSCPPVAAHPS